MKSLVTAFCGILLLSLISGCATSTSRTYDAEKCTRLSQEAEELRGKPIRRSAKMEQYKLECT